MVSPVREGLRPYEGRLIECCATLERWGARRGNRYGALCLVDLAVNGRIVADHVWIDSCRAFALLDLAAGDALRFRARCEPYASGGVTNYGLQRAHDPGRLGDRHPYRTLCTRHHARRAASAATAPTEGEDRCPPC